MEKNNGRVSLELLTDVISKRKFDRQYLKVSANLCCPHDFSAFAGHFPDQPVLPAVIQMAVVRMLSAELLNRSLHLEKAEKVKFKNMVRPDETVFVEVEMKTVGDKWQADFHLKNHLNTIAAGKLLFSEIEG